MAEERCKHENLGHVEIIQAYHQTYYEDGKPLFNCEVGGFVRSEVTCYDCDRVWIVKPSSPKFIRDFDKKVSFDRETKM